MDSLFPKYGTITFKESFLVSTEYENLEPTSIVPEVSFNPATLV